MTVRRLAARELCYGSAKMKAGRPFLQPTRYAVAALLALTGCTQPGPPPGASPASVAPAIGRHADPGTLMRGAALFREHCAACHGAQAQGTPNWHKPLADGRMPPPPLDGGGHAWHHPRSWLKLSIRDGLGPTRGMPAFGAKLADADIEAVIDWFQSLWPEEIYLAWAQMDAAASPASGR
jgi:mono/diheme cytochrome c family protein